MGTTAEAAATAIIGSGDGEGETDRIGVVGRD